MKILLIILSILFLRGSSSAQLQLKKKDVSCQGLNDGTLEAILEGIDGPFDYDWSNGMKSKKITGLKPGDYTVTVSVNEECMATKSGRIYDGPQFSVSISARLLDVSPKPLPCGMKPTFTYQLTAIPHGGRPPYYCSWGGNSDLGDGTCSITVTGKSISKNVVMSDSSGCADSETWEKRGATKMCPKDPNDISGNGGYADPRWVSIHDELNYTVRFENDPIFATSSAGVVLVTALIDDDIDPFSFRLTSMGFGNKIIEVPDNISYYQRRLDYTADIGFMVDVTAGLDLPNNRFFWLFETIDPATGQPPTDPTAGFLPVNDTLTGSGEGFINFVCKPKSNTPTGEIVSQKAAIVFDLNDPIETNTWENKIDAFPPVTTTDLVPDTFYTNVIPFAWNVHDDAGGCGVQHSQIFISTDNNEFESNGFIVDSTLGSLTLNWGTKYYYMILASDNVGNREEGTVDSFYIVPQRSIEFISPDQDHYCIGDTLLIYVELTSIADVDLLISIDSGMTFTPLASNVSSWPFPLLLDSALIHPYIFIKAVSDANLQKISDPFTVKYLPVIDAGLPVEGCDNEVLFVQATGANEYFWWPDSILGTTTERYSNVYADVSQYAYVRGTNVYGCSAIDSVFLTVHQHTRDTLAQPLCEGDSIYINSQWIKEEGYYATTYSNVNNCDSIIITNVQFQYPCIWPGGLYVFVDQDATGLNNGTSWNNAFTDLQDAIYVAGRYENVKEIWVAEGVYKPHASRRDTSFVLKDSIRIYGGFIGNEVTRSQRTTNAALVQLNGDINIPDTLWDNSYHTVVMAEQCHECVIDGVTITYGHADQSGNSNGVGAGVMNFGHGHFFNVIFERNYATDFGAALHSSGNMADLIIENCLFRLNTSSLGRDVMNLNGAHLEFRGANGIQ